MQKLVLLTLSALFFSGCASVSHTPLSKDVSAKLQGKSVVRTQYGTPDFTAFTAGKAAFAILGAVAMISEGNAIVKDNSIPDPASQIAGTLSERLAAERTMRIVVSQQVAQTDDVNALLRLYAGADYILDVKTFIWMFNYYPSDWAHYKVTYTARMRLIDVAQRSVVGESMCRTVQGDDIKPPSKDELLSENASLLKAYLAKGATACSDVLAKDVLQL